MKTDDDDGKVAVFDSWREVGAWLTFALILAALVYVIGVFVGPTL